MGKGKKEEKSEEEIKKALEEERIKNYQKLLDEAKEYSLRKAILEDSVKYFENLLSQVRDHKIPLRTEAEWIKFLKCEKIPNTKIPSDIRAFLHKFQLDYEEYFDRKVNWWLNCDERSDMHQDVTRNPDVRRRIINKIRKPIGSFYDTQIRLMMKAYESLEDSIRRKKVSGSRLNDLIKLQESFRETTLKFLDVLTLEIIAHIDREMNSMTPLIAQYAYTSSPDFIKFIWSFKDVTLPDDRENLRVIKMDPLHMSLMVSKSLDMELSAVRGLWLKHDFFSDYCPSYKPSHDMTFIDLATAVEMEMKVRRQMTNKHLDEMRRERAAYEKKMEDLAKEESSKKNVAVVVKKDDKKKKVEIVPPVVDETTYVDVNEEYITFENMKINEEMENLSPMNLNLNIHDVNMREFQILGGIYKIECVMKPLQTKEIYFQMFIRLNELPNILHYTPFHEIYIPPKLKQDKEERKSQFGRKLQEAKDEALSTLFKVELKLSDKIIWWECPTACRWEPWEESDEFKEMHEKIQDYNLNYEKYIQKEQEKLFKNPDPFRRRKKLEIEDIQLSDYPEKIKLSTLVQNYLASMIPEEFLTHDEAVKFYEQKQVAWKKYVDHLRAKKYRREKIEKILKLEEFIKLFEMKNAPPRRLFPAEFCKRIKTIENLEKSLEVKELRDEMRNNNEPPIDVVINEDFPNKNEPLMLSELILRFKEFQEKLKPNFKDIKIDFTEKISKKDKPKNKVKRKSSKIKRSSRISRRSTVVKTSNNSQENSDDGSDVTTKSSDITLTLIPHHKGKWSTQDIYEQSYDDEEKILTFYVGKLGNFGIAARKFYNLPLKHWEIYPVIQKKAERFVILVVESQNISMEFKITSSGYFFKIIKPLKAPIQELKKPVKVFELKKILTSINVNLFPEVDSSWYIQNTSEKHNAMEFHAYKSMATYCLSHHFKHEPWNSKIDRRSAIIKSRQIDKKVFKNILITPLNVLSINLLRTECIDGLEVDSIYEIDPLEQEFHPDLLNFLKNEVDNTEHRINQQSFMVMWYLQALLNNMRPLSFSD